MRVPMGLIDASWDDNQDYRPGKDRGHSRHNQGSQKISGSPSETLVVPLGSALTSRKHRQHQDNRHADSEKADQQSQQPIVSGKRRDESRCHEHDGHQKKQAINQCGYN